MPEIVKSYEKWHRTKASQRSFWDKNVSLMSRDQNLHQTHICPLESRSHRLDIDLEITACRNRPLLTEKRHKRMAEIVQDITHSGPLIS